MSGRDRVVRAAPAKINLVLDLLGPREDGYTEIATVFQTVELADTVRVTLDRDGDDATRLEVRPRAPCPDERNLAVLAARAYRTASGLRGTIAIELDKRIPDGAGLGGGSSDAAAVLLALERLSGTPLGAERLAALAAGLGADVPYFLVGGLAVGRGRGEQVAALDDLAPRPVVLARVDEPLPTAEVYRRARAGLTPCADPPNIRRFFRYLEEGAAGRPPVFNALERAAAALRPGIPRLVERLARLGGRAAMTGSGSAVFALFEDDESARAAARDLARREPDAWIEVTRTLPRGVRG
ncbi:MAG: 4-(cytidine 5'-diphospho)-2-C-methyl-D-erythritol kinase [Acidobacteriota bacterium]